MILEHLLENDDFEASAPKLMILKKMLDFDDFGACKMLDFDDFEEGAGF